MQRSAEQLRGMHNGLNLRDVPERLLPERRHLRAMLDFAAKLPSCDELCGGQYCRRTVLNVQRRLHSQRRCMRVMRCRNSRLPGLHKRDCVRNMRSGLLREQWRVGVHAVLRCRRDQ